MKKRSKRQASVVAVKGASPPLAFKSTFDENIVICHSLSPAAVEQLIADLYAALIGKSPSDGLDWRPMMQHFAVVTRADGRGLGLTIQRGAGVLVVTAVEAPAEIKAADPSVAAAVAAVFDHHAHEVIGEAETFDEARAKAATYVKAWREADTPQERCGCMTIEVPRS